MRLSCCMVVAVGGMLTGCMAPPAEEGVSPRPSGDTGPPADEFRLYHDAAERLAPRLAERLAAQPHPDPDTLQLLEAVAACRGEAGRLGYEVGTADPASPLGADALFACLGYRPDGTVRRREALDLLVQHHPNDARLGASLCELMETEGGPWLGPVLERVTASAAHPTVRAAAQIGRGRMLLASADPSEVAAGERLLAETLRDYPEAVGGLLAAHPRLGGAIGSGTVRLAP